MKDFYISDATRFENQVITSSFVVITKQAKPKKSGELYLALTLGDRTGHIEAKMWDNVAETLNIFEQDDFVKIRGLINKFNGRFQLTVHKLRSMEETEVDFDDYLPRTTKDIPGLWNKLGDFVASFRDPHRSSRPLWLILKSSGRTRTRLRRRRCTTLSSAGCWTTWCRCFSSATWLPPTTRR
jgi:3'-5' exoribonuclease